jgi:AraC-like DNA-binding protein
MNPFVLPIKTYNLNVKIHKHSAYQIIISLDKPFDTVIHGISYAGIYGFIIKPQVSHLCTLVESTLVIINVEPYSVAGTRLKSFFNDKEYKILFSKRDEISKYFELNGNLYPEYVTTKIIDHFKNEISDVALDDRIVKLITYIKDTIHQELSLKSLATLVFLSPSRVASLFKEQTGSSISKYILWTRLRKAVTLTLTNKSLTLTEIAIETGFYDLSQFNKYMYEMIGVSPSVLKQNGDLIQAY